MQVHVNGTLVPILSSTHPLYVKDLVRPLENTLSIRVFQCCCVRAPLLAVYGNGSE